MSSDKNNRSLNEGIKCNIDRCNSPTSDTICCAMCSDTAHRECINMEKKFFDALKYKKYLGVTWNCSKCSTKTEQKNNELSKLILEVRNELKQELCDEIKR